MKLYELSSTFKELFDRFEELSTYEFDTDDEGNAIDDDGNIIADPDAMREDMLQAWFDTLEGIEEEFGDKAENVLVYIKELTAEVKEMKQEKSRLSARISSKERQAERLKEYILNCMDDLGIKRLNGIKASCTLCNNPESVEIKDELGFINWAQNNELHSLLRYSDPEINKTAVKNLLKDGENLPYSSLIRTRSLRIK